jgi:hypothetical protein
MRLADLDPVRATGPVAEAMMQANPSQERKSLAR